MVARILSLLICWFLPLSPAVMAQSVVAPEAVTIENGLSQGMVFDMCQTRDGFMWMATKDGLNRYDGYNFKIFTNDPFDPFSLAENTVTALFEDSRGRLWVGTESKGLDLYDRRNGRFYHFPLNFKRNIKGFSSEIYALCEASDGAICVLQRGCGLIRIVLPDAWEKQLPAEPDLSGSAGVTLFPLGQFIAADAANEDIEGIPEPLPNGNLLVFSNKKTYLVEPAEHRVRPVPEGQWPEMNNTEEHDIWVDFPAGFICFRNGRALLLDFPPGLKIKWIMAKPAAGNDVWVAVNHQLWLLSPGENLDFSKPDWEIDENITTVIADRNGNIWVGTQGYGLRKINPAKQLFHKGATGTSIWGLWRDAGGAYFCKVVYEVFPYDPVTGKIGSEHAFPDGPGRLLDVCMEPSGSYWLLGRGNEDNGMAELRLCSPEHVLSRPYPFHFSSYTYARLLRNREGDIWITGANCQLIRFHPPTGRFDYLDYAALFGENANAVRAFALAEDGNGVLWIGTQQGLIRCTPKGSSFDYQLMQADAKNPLGLSSNSIACLLVDPHDPGGVLWVGTKGGGINRLDLHNNHFQHIAIKDGLPDNVIYGILPGNKNDLWCSTNRGLFRITPRYDKGQTRGAALSFDVTTFTAAQGLQDNEFNTQAFYKASNGELLFGGVNGLNRFFPEALRADSAPPPVFIVGLQINHQPAAFGSTGSPLTAPLDFLQELRLNHDQNNLSFEFAALDFTDPSKNRYRYRLVGLDPDWVETGTNRFAHFTHLAPGRYTLRVQGSNGEGAWQNASTPVTIIIQPPWWRSRPAYLLYALLIVWAGWQAYRFQIRRVQLREQLAFEQRESGRIKALEEMKTNFFSNVTHEFRTPLTLMLEPTRRILAKTRDPEIIENARHVEANSQRLMALVNQLLDMAKLESGSMGLDLRLADVTDTVREVYRSFLPLAEQCGIRLTLKIPAEIPPFLFDSGKVELVLNNLISNALKFTSEGGTVTVACRKEVPEAGAPESSPVVQISVVDTGIGIPAAAQEKVFERFYQVDGSHTRAGEGTGIGLALSKELVNLMGGSIALKSETGMGSEFIFRLPLKESAAVLPSPSGEAVPAFAAPQETSGEMAERPSVLLIEDNAELRGFIKQYISRAWEVVEASNGEEGVRKAAELVPDLVISDLMMPLKDGYAVCDELKNGELTAHIPVILLTAKSGMDSKIKGLRTGADDYLTKPFNTDELLARMENLVTLRRHLRRRYGRQPSAAEQPTVAEAEYLTPPDREFLRRFTLTLEQHLPDETMSVEDLARKMLISRVQLHRKLKALTDRNVTDFVRDYRLDRAMAMLKNREGLVYEVASKVGFGSEKYFSRAFKEKFGVSPSQVV